MDNVINIGTKLEPIIIPPIDLEHDPWSAPGDPSKIDATKIKNLEVNTLNVSTSGYIRSGKISFTDSTNPGYFLSNEGIYIGSASDVSVLKFDITTGAFNFVGTVSGRNTNALAFGDEFGNLTQEVINAKLDTSSKEILGDFTFGESGALKMITDANNGLWISPTGILGKKAGANTFAIDTNGNATFNGDITGSTGTFGNVTITSGSISWSTVAGTTNAPVDNATDDTVANQAQADASQAILDASTAQATADGKVVTFYQGSGTAIPTADGIGDLWIDTDDGNRLYRWSGSSWEEIQDTDIATAIANASTAQSTADGKIVSFYQDGSPTAEGVGDFWVDTDDDNKLYRWNGSNWISIRDAGIAAAIQSAADAQSTADGKIITFYQDGEPTGGESSVGDLWIDTNDGNKLYRYSGATWVESQDNEIAQALSDASGAQSTADGKIVSFYATSAPTAEGIGDLWFDTDNNMRPWRWNGSSWQNITNPTDWADVGDPGSTKPYNNATVGANWSTNLSNIPDSAEASYITSTRITAITIESPTISAGTVTGTTIQTSSSSNTGIKMSSAIGGMNVYGETIEIFDTSGTKYGTIGSGGAYLDIASYSNRNIRISPWGGTVFFGLNSGSGIAPTTSGQGYCGLSSQVWANVYTNNVTIGSSYMNYSDSKMQIHSDTKISGTIYATGAIECTTARIKVGSYNLYPTTGAYDSSKYYLRS